MTDPAVPEQAVTDALKAAPEQHISLGHWEPIMSRADMRRTLAAAVPHILSDAADRLKAATAAELTAICTETVIEATAEANARISELEQLANDILATFTKGSDGYRARVGQVQIGKWETTLRGH